MTTQSTLRPDHFGGHKNLTPGQRHGEGPTLQEYLESVRVDTVSLEAFVDSLRQPKDACRLATAAALPACTAAGSRVGKTLTADANGALTVDGVATAPADRVLVKDQAVAANNGIYDVTDEGAAGRPFVLTRATDADEDDEITDSMTVPVTLGTVNANSVWQLTTPVPLNVDTTALAFTRIHVLVHAATHIRGASDEVDGDLVDVDYVPTNYTRTVTAPATNAEHLTAHLAGLDVESANMVQHGGVIAGFLIEQAGQPVATNLLTVGADVYEADGAGANINFAIGIDAATTMANLLAAAVANGTEDLTWDALSPTVIQVLHADAPQGTPVVGVPDILVTNALVNYQTDLGTAAPANMNTLAGRADGQVAMSTARLDVTADMVTLGQVRVRFPFTVTGIAVSIFDVTGVLKAGSGADTFVFAVDEVTIVLNGGVGDIDPTDVVQIIAFA